MSSKIYMPKQVKKIALFKHFFGLIHFVMSQKMNEIVAKSGMMNDHLSIFYF